MDGRDPSRMLIVGAFERMPICGRTIPFAAMNQTTICTMETEDGSGAKRGAVVIGIAHSSTNVGTASYSTIEEADALIALLQNAVADARRIENGEVPLAPEGIEPAVKH